MENSSGKAYPIGSAILVAIIATLVVFIVNLKFHGSNVPIKRVGPSLWIVDQSNQIDSVIPAVHEAAKQRMLKNAVLIRNQLVSWERSHPQAIAGIGQPSSDPEAIIANCYDNFRLTFPPSQVQSCVTPALLSSKDAVFTWNGAPISNSYWDRGSSDYSTIAGMQIRSQAIQTYNKYHDVIVSQSYNYHANGYQVAIWASGKITYGKTTLIKAGHLGQLSLNSYSILEND